MPKAVSLLHRKRIYDDGAISEVRLWILQDAVPGSLHKFKYSLFYGYPGSRAVAYDDERGKGEHRHMLGRETPYKFESLGKLLADFEADIKALLEQNAEGPESSQA
jgi:hypothetical protein